MKQALIKFIITVLIVSLFCWLSSILWLRDLVFPVAVLWIAVIISCYCVWNYKFYWPLGRYNGDRIDGFKLTFHIHLLWWRFKPMFRWNHGIPYFLWLCVSIRGEASYKD